RFVGDGIGPFPPERRRVSLLWDVLQSSTYEVAARLRISAMAVRLRLFRAHRRLREKLSIALQPSKPRISRAAASIQKARRCEERKREQRISLPAFAECSCGD